jgi:peptidoglycan/LPS O-acetylase OafA/YrhL
LAVERLDALTGLRFFAAVSVVSLHYLDPSLQAPALIHWVLAIGNTGVSLFFVLSGFVLAYTYLDAGPVNRRFFWVSRFARIYPVYLVALILAVALMHEGNRPALLASVLMVQAWNPYWAVKINYPAWSLSVEALFYAVFPFVAVRVFRARSLLATGILLSLAAIASPAAYLLAIHMGARPFSTFLNGIVSWNPIGHLPIFLLGVLAAAALRRNRGRHATLLSLVTAGSLLALLPIAQHYEPQLANGGFAAPAFAVMIYALAYAKGPLAAMLSLSPIVLLGEASYSIYILQAPVHAGLALLVPWRGPGLFLVYLPALLIIALISLVVVERPLRGGLRRLLAPSNRPLTALDPVPAPTPSALES